LTCRHFRRSVAGSLSYCGLDRRRTPLVGDEVRACWEAAPVPAEAGRDRAAPTVADGKVRRLDFVPLDLPGTSPEPRIAQEPAAPTVPLAAPSPGQGVGLWADLD
jgi:hypothetical protein